MRERDSSSRGKKKTSEPSAAVGGEGGRQKGGRERKEAKNRRRKEREKKGEKKIPRERGMLWLSRSPRARTHTVKYTRTQARISTVIRNITWYRRITQSWAGLCLTGSISPSPPTSPWTRVPYSRVSSILSPVCPTALWTFPTPRDITSHGAPWHTSNRACTTSGSPCTAVSLPSPAVFLRVDLRPV